MVVRLESEGEAPAYAGVTGRWLSFQRWGDGEVVVIPALG